MQGIVYLVNMINRQHDFFIFHGINIAVMMFRQHDRRSERPINPVVDRGDLGDLDGLDGRVDDRSAQSFIVSGAARWRRNADAVAAECFKLFVVDMELRDERCSDAFQGYFVQGEKRFGSAVGIRLHFEYGILDQDIRRQIRFRHAVDQLVDPVRLPVGVNPR